MTDEVVVFKDNDEGYLAWSRAHPDGFVVNALRGTLGDPVLHRADCWSITTRTGERELWTHDYVKLCAEATGPLVMWGYQTHGTGVRECQQCDPSGERARTPPLPRGKTKTIPATPQVVETWLARLRGHHEVDARVASMILAWCSDLGMVAAFTGPEGKPTAETFVPLIALSGANVAPFGVKAGDLRVFLGGDGLRTVHPFTTQVAYDEMVERVLTISGMRPTPKSRYPNISLVELEDGATWSRFTEIFGRIIDEVRAAN
jgi:hypothetical protein